MDLGQFSVSLSVKDIKTSKKFYEALGFEAIEGAYKSKDYPPTETTDWLIMKNDSAVIGLFMGMFEENILTINPRDVRSIQKKLKEDGIKLITEADEESTGPAHLSLKDPDGNSILIDQHQ